MSPEIEALFYAKSLHQAEVVDSYIQIHVKKKPKFMPKMLYHYLLRRLLEMQHFVKLNKKDPRLVNLGEKFEELHVTHDGFDRW